METSQQQRRPAIGSFIETLTNAQLDFDAIDLADMLWLAQFIEPTPSVQPEASNPQPTQQSGDRPPEPTPLSDSAEPALNLYPDAPPSRAQSQPERPPQTPDPKPAKPQGTPFSVPAAPALRTRLDLARSLRPLMRKVPSRSRFDLDEAATVNQIAETEVWMPIVRPTAERWLELDLVVEASKTTVIWERAIAELSHLAEYQGAFRTVRTWRLSAPSGTVQLFSRWRDRTPSFATEQLTIQRPHTPRELIDPTGRRLIWLVTDCTSSLWRQDAIYETLMAWATEQPVAIVQMFPERLWSRTALRDGHIVRLSAIAPGLPSAQLTVEGLPQRLERHTDRVTVPVITPDAPSVKRWAQVVAGAGESRTPGLTFDLSFIRRQAIAPSASRTSRSPAQRTAQERVALFRATASATVQHLAELMAAAPVSLPVIDLLRDAFRADFEEEVQQSHVAEVLLSGLLQRCDTEEEVECRYEVWGDRTSNPTERVRDILLGDASIAKSIKVLNVLSASICQKFNSPTKSFQALLGELQTLEGDLRDAVLPFAKVGLDVLRRLGGDYAALAEQVEQATDLETTELQRESPAPFPELKTLEFESAHLREAGDPVVAIPDLQLDTFTIATIELEPADSEAQPQLQHFSFTVATLSQEEGQWGIQRQQQSNVQFIERLPDDNTLEMVSIPAGTFLMGSPKHEPDSYSDEKPQHEVSVPAFFMGRYPVTQAQWRAIAMLPPVNRELKPDPSRFKGANRPVERVSWWDAVEFCARLSQLTGRDYRLPSEAEWEYACRAGTTTPFHFGETITTELANYRGNSTYNNGPQGEYREETTPVDQFGVANAFGLVDMHGNVWEWCLDHWHNNYEGAPTDGSAWLREDKNSNRVWRGGSWFYFPGLCRSASRSNGDLGYGLNNIGFRVVCGVP